MQDPSTSGEEPGRNTGTDSKSTPETRPRVIRRHYVIDRRRQFRTAALTSGLAFLLLLVVNVAFGFLRASQAMMLTSAAPQLKPVLEAQDAKTATLLAVVSLVFIVGVFILTIAETHRTAGAIYAVKQRLDRVRDGDLHVRLQLRPRDNLRDLRGPFDEMVGALRERTLADADTLGRLAEEASDNPELAAKLRTLADEKRTLAS